MRGKKKRRRRESMINFKRTRTHFSFRSEDEYISYMRSILIAILKLFGKSSSSGHDEKSVR